MLINAKNIKMKQIITYFKLVRAGNLLIIAATLYVMRIFIFDTYLSYCNYKPMIGNGLFFALVVAMMLIAAAGYIINDYFDQSIDGINKPEKQIVGTLVPSKHAQNLFYVLSGIGFLIFTIAAWKVSSINLAIIPVITVMMLWYYSFKYKRLFLWGNIVVAFLSAFIIIVYWLFEFFAMKHNAVALVDCNRTFRIITQISFIYFGFAFIVSLIREIIKDIVDIEGDRSHARKTLPIVLGTPKTKRILFALLSLFFVSVLFLQIKLYLADSVWIVIYSVVMISFPIIYVFAKLLKAKLKEEFNFISTLLKVIMILGILFLIVYRYTI